MIYLFLSFSAAILSSYAAFFTLFNVYKNPMPIGMSLTRHPITEKYSLKIFSNDKNSEDYVKTSSNFITSLLFFLLSSIFSIISQFYNVENIDSKTKVMLIIILFISIGFIYKFIFKIANYIIKTKLESTVEKETESKESIEKLNNDHIRKIVQEELVKISLNSKE